MLAAPDGSYSISRPLQSLNSGQTVGASQNQTGLEIIFRPNHSTKIPITGSSVSTTTTNDKLISLQSSETRAKKRHRLQLIPNWGMNKVQRRDPLSLGTNTSLRTTLHKSCLSWTISNRIRRSLSLGWSAQIQPTSMIIRKLSHSPCFSKDPWAVGA